MTVDTVEIEGTWEEIAAQAAQFAGRRMRLIILPDFSMAASETKDCCTLEEKIIELFAAVPEEEWAKFPADMGDQLDHYIYGTPKRQ